VSDVVGIYVYTEMIEKTILSALFTRLFFISKAQAEDEMSLFLQHSSDPQSLYRAVKGISTK